MSGWTMGVIELGLIFLPILGWAIWELWSLRREQRRDKAASAERATHRAANRAPHGSGHAEGQHGANGGGPQPP